MSKLIFVKNTDIFIPLQTVFVGGWEGGRDTVFTLSVCLTVLVFQYLEKAMTEFHKIWQTHWYPQDEHLK